MADDSRTRFGQITPLSPRGKSKRVPSVRSDARWSEAIMFTVALQLFVLLIFLPRIIERHRGINIQDIALDSSTMLVSMVLGLLLFAVFRLSVPWSGRTRIVLLMSTVTVFSVFNALFDLFWTVFVAQNLQASWTEIPSNLWRAYAAAFNYFLVFSVNLALFQLSFARRRSLTTERQLVDAQSEAHQAQLAALRYQINPHFLFNALNSISALIVTRRNEDAEQMTSKLSGFLRSSLSTDPAELVPLEEELHLIEEYLDLESVRFGERLDATIDCEPEAGDALVPGFLVQPLVENAIKHGVGPSRDPVHIQIKAIVEEGDLCITVENDRIEGAGDGHRGTGVGLENVRRRLQTVYGGHASLEVEARPSSYCATICIPEVPARGH